MRFAPAAVEISVVVALFLGHELMIGLHAADFWAFIHLAAAFCIPAEGADRWGSIFH